MFEETSQVQRTKELTRLFSLYFSVLPFVSRVFYPLLRLFASFTSFEAVSHTLQFEKGNKRAHAWRS